MKIALRRLCITLCIVMVATAAGAADRVKVRGGLHEGFGRLVFDWPEPVPYEARIENESLVVSFGASGEFDTSALRGMLPDYVGRADVAADGRRISFPLVTDITLRHFTLGSRVVIDLVSVPKLRAPKKPRHADVHPASLRSQNATAEPTKAAMSRPAPKPERAVNRVPDIAPRTQDERQEALTHQTARKERGRTPRPPGDHIGPTSQTDYEYGSEPPLISANPPPAGAEPTPSMEGDPTPRKPVTMRFPWAKDAGVAAFRHGEYLWLVFDRLAPPDFVGAMNHRAPDVGAVERFDAGGATVLRLRAAPGIFPHVSHDVAGWTVDLRRQSVSPPHPLELTIDLDDRFETRIVVPARGARRVLSLTDPVLRDRLVVVPLADAEQGLAEGSDFPEFRVLPTLQGFVVRPLADGVEVLAEESAITLSSEDGLLVSSPSVRVLRRSRGEVPAEARRLFDPVAWRRGGTVLFYRARQDLQRAILDAEGGSRALRYLDLARFYFAHGLATEAMGALDLMTASDPRLARDPEVVLIQAASAVLAHDLESAVKLLDDPALSGESEAALWRAAAAASAQDWPAAAELFAEADELIEAYAQPLRTRLNLLAAEARLGIGDTGGASLHLEQIREDAPTPADLARADFLEGHRLWLDGDGDTARELWRTVAERPQRPAQARARLMLLDASVEGGSIDTDEIIARLERLRFAWRGDDFELHVLRRLGGLYLDTKQYRAGLLTLRQAASNFPGSSAGEEIAAAMRAAFARLFLEHVDALSPLKALAIYEEFRELTPIGSEGDRIIAALADRLVEVDLLDRAADLLDRQIRFRLDGVDKARTGARLALVYLLAQRAEQALDALTLSAAPNLPHNLLQHRQHLEARCLAELGRTAEALGVLDGDDSADGLRLRAEILWRQRDWPGVAEALAKILPGRVDIESGLSESDSRLVRNLAVALSLGGDRAGLEELARRFSVAMAETPYGEAFALLTEGVDQAGQRSISEQLARVEAAEAFMSRYRESLDQARPATLD